MSNLPSMMLLLRGPLGRPSSGLDHANDGLSTGMNVQVFQADPTTGANIGPYTQAENGQCIAVQVTGNFVPNVPTFSMIQNPCPMTAKALVDCEAN